VRRRRRGGALLLWWWLRGGEGRSGVHTHTPVILYVSRHRVHCKWDQHCNFKDLFGFFIFLIRYSHIN
jgi:hypothetical protein